MSDESCPVTDPFHDPNLLSLAEALTRLESMPEESAARIARTRAAVAMFGRLLHKLPAEIPAHANFVKRRFIQFKHRPTGLSAKSLSNCKTELRYLIRVVCGRGRRSPFAPLADEWARLRDAIVDQPTWWKLSRLMSFCSLVGIAPGAVNDEVMERFREAIRESDDVTRPDGLVREAVKAWNRLAATQPEWPQTRLSVAPRRYRRWTLEPSRFPESFRRNVDGWQESLSKIDPEAEEGRTRPLRTASLKLHRHQVFAAASALVLSGRPIESVTSLACLVDLDAFKAIMAFLRQRKGGKPTRALLALAKTLKAIAKHQERMSEQHVQRMARICANYAGDLEGQTTKSQVRLQAFEDDRFFAALLHLPGRLLEEAGLPKTSPRRARSLAQIAVAIEIEWHAALRVSNLVALNLHRNIQAVKTKGKTRWIIRFDRHETKNRALLTYELPSAVVERINHAFKFYEPTDGWLFPGKKGSHKLPSLLGNQVKHEVERRLGVPFNIHLFRALFATTQVKENDYGLEIARAGLGDKSDRVVRTHYTAAAERHLIAKGQETIQRVRLRTAPLVPPRSGKRVTNRGIES